MATDRKRNHPSDLVDTAWVCDRLDVDRQTVRRFIREEGLPCYVLSVRTHRFRVGEVEAWVEARRARTAA